MPRISLLDRGTIDDDDSAFPQAAELSDGSLICAYSDAGGQFATGGTSVSRSADGRTWQRTGTLLAVGTDPPSSNYLKVSRDPSLGGDVLYAYGARSTSHADDRFGERTSEAIACTSHDGGTTWSTPSTVPMPTALLEISHGILPLRSGRLLAPAATIEPGRLGERVVVAISDDGGETWQAASTALVDPDGRLGYLEQKLTELDDGRVLATAWTVTLDDVADRPNSYTISSDGGLTWSAPRSIGTDGQTLSAVHLGGERFLLLYNRRYGDQGVVAAAATFDGEHWMIDAEMLVHDAARRRDGRQYDDGVDEMLDFQFGFPTAIVRRDGAILVTYWAVIEQRCGIRWAQLSVTW